VVQKRTSSTVETPTAMTSSSRQRRMKEKHFRIMQIGLAL
jgi:hypothetical protein